MKISTLYMLEADEGKVLVKDGIYVSSVLLKKGETEEGWSEITQEEYQDLMKNDSENN